MTADVHISIFFIFPYLIIVKIDMFDYINILYYMYI
jgi:hypothetical protein